MTESFKVSDAFQTFGTEGFDSYFRSYGKLNKGFQEIADEWTDYSNKAFRKSTKALEKMAGAKSVEDLLEVQTKYAQKAYEAYIAEITKLGEMYTKLMQTAFTPNAR
ncbi:MAG: phasin family protein [Methyloceanibacter sp.]|nr:phasin family protein [Methyloceanibacter sp.]